MSQNQFWHLLAKKLSGEASAEEITKLETLMREHPEWVYAAAHIEDLWKIQQPEQDQYDTELAFEIHLNKLKEQGIYLQDIETTSSVSDFMPPENRPRKKGVLLFSSVFVFASVMAFVFIKPFDKKQQLEPTAKNYSEVSTRLGSKSKLVLPDSTIVWLNSGSKLSYSENFGRSNRNTILSGEAFFEVRKSDIPFIIETNSIKVKVLGTAFNVKSYPNEKTTETSLIRGTVEVTLNKRPGEKFILKPNEKLVVSNEATDTIASKKKKDPIVVLSGLTHFEVDQTIIETSWVNNKLVFQNDTFSEIAKKMERWYNVSIQITDEQLAQTRLTGTFENESVKQALTALQITAPFKFVITENEIIISK